MLGCDDAGLAAIQVIALNAAISASILAVPKARWAMMMALLLGPTRGAGHKPTRPARTDAALFRPDRPFPLIAQPVRAPYHSPQQREKVPLAREQRKLAAILAADVVGYSRLMGRDESGTLARLREHRTQRLEPVLARHRGRLVKLTGDGALVEFASAVDALGAAIEFQQAMANANREQPEDTTIVFRIGLHLGDLIVEGDDLYGDGVNIAARLEAEAPPGGIIVSRAVREAVEGRLRAKLHALGELTLKNIERPIRAFRVEWDEADWQAANHIPSEATSTGRADPRPARQAVNRRATV